MIYCDRCGYGPIDLKGMCDDCKEVEPQVIKRIWRTRDGMLWLFPTANTKPGGRRHHMRDLDAEAADLEFYWLRKRGLTYQQIGEQMGIHYRHAERVGERMGFKRLKPYSSQQTGLGLAPGQVRRSTRNHGIY